MIQRCEECQIHGIKKSHLPSRQISAAKPMEVIATDIMNFDKQPVLVTVDYFSGYIMIDPLKSETSNAVAAQINDKVRKFGLAEIILSDNGPCFRSEMFHNFCESLEIHHSKTSPYHHQSNGRVERAIQTVRKIFKKSKSDIEVTQASLAYHDTPISSELPLQQNCS